jgi:hypothetical protein
MIVFRVWKDSLKDNWHDCLTEAEAIDLNFGFGYDETVLSSFDINQYTIEVNQLHDDLFKSYYEPLDYVSKEEIAIWVDNPTYSAEATILLDWYWLTWELIKQHLETVTEETADAETFINNLPKL